MSEWAGGKKGSILTTFVNCRKASSDFQNDIVLWSLSLEGQNLVGELMNFVPCRSQGLYHQLKWLLQNIVHGSPHPEEMCIWKPLPPTPTAHTRGICRQETRYQVAINPLPKYTGWTHPGDTTVQFWRPLNRFDWLQCVPWLTKKRVSNITVTLTGLSVYKESPAHPIT